MTSSLRSAYLLCFLFIVGLVSAQNNTTSGYTGYSLSLEGDSESVNYQTGSTPGIGSKNFPPPDVFLNASVEVGEIDINVSNLTAKINLDAQVLKLLEFNAGVDLSIDRVSLLIEKVKAKVLLEARLENLVEMISSTLDSLDLNPALAKLGQTVGDVAGSVTDTVSDTASGALSSAGSLLPRSFELDNNILYSINDYSGNMHTNRILAQDGSIVDQSLDNDGNISNRRITGSYLADMTFNGNSQSVVKAGQDVRELEYVYTPFNGLSVVSAIYVDAEGTVLATQVLSESGGGGSSTIEGEDQ